MNEFEETLKDIDFFCTSHQIPYSIIGGLALISYKIQRTTNDIDITILTDLERIPSIGELIIKEFRPFLDNPIQFFQSNFVLPVLNKNKKIRIDFAAGLTGFDQKVIERCVRKPFGKLLLPFCSIEDLILYKLFAGRPKDTADLYEIAKMYKEILDKNYLKETLREFAKLEREDMKINFNKIFRS